MCFVSKLPGRPAPRHCQASRTRGATRHVNVACHVGCTTRGDEECVTWREVHHVVHYVGASRGSVTRVSRRVCHVVRHVVCHVGCVTPASTAASLCTRTASRAALSEAALTVVPRFK